MAGARHRASSAASTCSSTTPRSTRAAPGPRSPRRSGTPCSATNLKGYFLCARACHDVDEGAGPRPDRQHLARSRSSSASTMLLDYVVVEGWHRRLHARARARGRAGGDHGQRDRAGRLPDGRREDPPRSRGLHQWVLDQQSLKRRGTPEDIGNLVVFLAERRLVVHHRPDDRDRRRLGDALRRRAGARRRGRGRHRRRAGHRRGDRARARRRRGRASRDAPRPRRAASLARAGHPRRRARRALDRVGRGGGEVGARSETPTVLVNNAGVNRIGPAESFAEERLAGGARRQPDRCLPLLPARSARACSPLGAARSSTSPR